MFEELLFEVIDDTVRQVFGESNSELIYALIERHVMVKQKDAGERIEAFHAYLERLLGSEGARIIQATSIKRLWLKLRREYNEVEKYFSVLDEIYEIKFKLLIPSLKGKNAVCN